MSLKEFYSPAGPLSRLPGYEFRPQQLQAALAIQKFLRSSGETAFAMEAPTGVGKTFAVLAPALREAALRGSHILFLTASIALQEQLIEKDLPRLRELLGFSFEFGLLKGRSNYACLRLARAVSPSLFDGSLDQWLDETETGDLAELEGDAAAIAAGSRSCIGSGCPFRDKCFVSRAYRRAQDWDLTVANYHLFFSHILEGSGSFPVAYDWLVCDEAHRLPDAAAAAAAVRVGADSAAGLLGPRTIQSLAAFLKKHSASAADLQELAGEARSEFQELFDLLPSLLPSNGELQAQDEGLLRRGKSLANRLDALLSPLRPIQERFMAGDFQDKADLAGGAELVNWIDEVREFKRSLLWCLSVEQFPRWAYWFSQAGALMSRPVMAAEFVREALQKEDPEKMIFTSATLTLSGKLDFWVRESGIQPDSFLAVDSPFDFERQMEVMVVDVGLGVMDKGYDERMCRVMEYLCDKNGGRTLILLSSLRLVRAFAQRMHGKPYAVLVQGDLPQRQLLRRFTQDETSILIGSVSFREGVDVPGEGLTQVIIDRIPFPHPNDPLVRARTQLEEGKGFMRVTLPRARLFLRQAAGRLIRSSSDHGRVVLLDGRAVERRDWDILASFPPCKCRRLTVRG